MKFVKIVILLLLVLWEKHQAFSKQAVEFDQFEEMMEQVVILLNSQSRIRLNNFAVLSYSRATIKWTPKSLERISLLNLKISNPRELFPVETQWYEKFHTYILITSIQENLRYLIEGLKNTTLWNPTALYILFDDRTVETGCRNAYSSLKIAWECDLLSSAYFCVDPGNGFMVYKYNPFVEWAPKSWKMVSSDKLNAKNHIWTLFRKKIIPGVTTGKDIIFHKTENLNGYPLKLLGLNYPPLLSVNLSNDSFDMFDGIDVNILRIIWTKWNVTLNTTLYPDNYSDYSYLDNMTSGQYDILLNNQYMFNKQHIQMTYPHVTVGLRILSRFRGYQEGYKKIVTYMNPTVIAGILFLFLATGYILAECTSQELMSAYLEVLRIMVGVSMRRFPKANPLRIYLITILILFIISSSTFQSNLSSLLSTPTPKHSINSIEDLKLLGYPLYIFEGYKTAIYDDIVLSQVRTYKKWDCSELVEKLEGVACAGDSPPSLKIAYEKDLYISRQETIPLHAAYVIRPNWPLTDRLSRMLIKLNEAGLILFWWERGTKLYKHKWSKLKADHTKKNYQVLMLHDMLFAFYILLFGYILSILIFIGEVLTKRPWKQKIRKVIGRKAVLPFVH